MHVQKQILDLIIDLKNRLGMAVLLISHDLNLVRRHADRVAVMRQGEIVETADTENIFSSPHHEYTQRLLAAEPRGEPTPVAPESPVLLSVKNLRAWFPIYHGVFRRVAGHVKAATDIKFELRAGQTLGIVGESGSGKSTTALAVLRLIEAEGSVNFRGQELMQLSPKNLRELRRHIQIVFQDPYGSLSPRMTVGDIINEGLRVHEHLDNDACAARIAEVLREVGLESAMADRYPHEFSGGQRQRIAIARALILKPELVVLDEPTSALDRTIQAQIVDLLRDLQRRHGLTYMVISHDLRTVRALAHEILVMKDGLIIEQGSVEQIFSAPHEEYTRQLLAAAFD